MHVSPPVRLIVWHASVFLSPQDKQGDGRQKGVRGWVILNWFINTTNILQERGNSLREVDSEVHLLYLFWWGLTLCNKAWCDLCYFKMSWNLFLINLSLGCVWLSLGGTFVLYPIQSYFSLMSRCFSAFLTFHRSSFDVWSNCRPHQIRKIF